MDKDLVRLLDTLLHKDPQMLTSQERLLKDEIINKLLRDSMEVA